MDSDHILKLYEEVKDDLKFISSSNVRAKIIISLNTGTTKLKDLKEELNRDASTILHAMRQLEDQNLIFKRDNEYVISQKGVIIGFKLTDMVKTLHTAKMNENLWLNHQIDDIPPHLLLRMGDLNLSNLVESELTDIFKPLDNFSQILMDSDRIRGLSPIFNPDFVETFKLMVESGKEVELILTPQIIKKMTGVMDPATLMQLGELISQEKLKLWTVNQDVKLAFTVTDKFLSLGLFKDNNEYDTTKDLVSDNPDAVTWGNSLFEYYRDEAHRFKF